MEKYRGKKTHKISDKNRVVCGLYRNKHNVTSDIKNTTCERCFKIYTTNQRNQKISIKKETYQRLCYRIAELLSERAARKSQIKYLRKAAKKLCMCFPKEVKGEKQKFDIPRYIIDELEQALK